MGNQKEQKEHVEHDAKCGEGRKRLREGGSQTDDDLKHVELKLSTLHCLDTMNAKLNEILAACSEIKTLKNEISWLRGELKSCKDSLDFANQEIETSQAGFAKTLAMVEENTGNMKKYQAGGVHETRKCKNLQC